MRFSASCALFAAVLPALIGRGGQKKDLGYPINDAPHILQVRSLSTLFFRACIAQDSQRYFSLPVGTSKAFPHFLHNLVLIIFLALMITRICKYVLFTVPLWILTTRALPLLRHQGRPARFLYHILLDHQSSTILPILPLR